MSAGASASASAISNWLVCLRNCRSTDQIRSGKNALRLVQIRHGFISDLLFARRNVVADLAHGPCCPIGTVACSSAELPDADSPRNAEKKHSAPRLHFSETKCGPKNTARAQWPGRP